MEQKPRVLAAVPPPVDNKEVRLVYTQSPVTIPGVMATETTLDIVRTPGLRMYQNERGLIVTVHNTTAFIPDTNIKICVYK